MTIKEYFETLDDQKAMGLAGAIDALEKWRRWRDEDPTFSVHQWPEERQEKFIQSFEIWFEEVETNGGYFNKKNLKMEIKSEKAGALCSNKA